ncbi:MAG: DUF4838 domain-containing protein [Bacteroidota bacterium]
MTITKIRLRPATTMICLLTGLLLFVSAFSLQAQTLRLAENAGSRFQIIAGDDTGTIAVSKIFSKYFKESTGVELAVWDRAEDLQHSILFYLLTGKDKEWSQLSGDGFLIETNSTDLCFYALNNRGLEYAVYTFLEKYLDCRCYTKNMLVVPKHQRLDIPQINLCENPSFQFRVSYNNNAFYEPFRSWQKLDNALRTGNEKDWHISGDWGLWVHTLHTLLPPSEYFATHPEYYALRSGVRNPAQLCLSNPEVLKLVIASLQKKMAEHPTAKYWSVSQMDNFGYCRCDKCRAIDSLEGSPSGSILRFVNQVAAAFPDKIISTLAYQYSRKPPLLTRPASNVNIMLCTIECDRSRPIEADTSAGGFASDIKGWAKITNNILVWDYVVNFSNSLLPFPNFPVLQANLKFFKDNHATMMFEQGFTTENTDLTDLRGYLLAKLMWNVNQNTDSLMNDFLQGYYGAAAPYLRTYINYMVDELRNSKKQLTLYEPASAHKEGYLSPQMVSQYFMLLDKASAAVGNDSVIQIRLENVRQGLRYAWLEVRQMMPHTPYWIFEQKPDGSYQVNPQTQTMLNELVAHAKKYGPSIFHEMGIPPAEYEKNMQAYFDRGVSLSGTKVKSITYATPYSPSYAADGPNTLIDGVFGTNNYFALWLGWWGKDVEATLELKETQKVMEVKLNCLDNSQSWILAPSDIIVSFSTDGKEFKQIGEVKNPKAGQKLEKQSVPFTIPLNKGKGVVAKYIRVFCKNQGKMPKWTGVVDGDTWVFIDEIEVN